MLYITRQSDLDRAKDTEFGIAYQYWWQRGHLQPTFVDGQPFRDVAIVEADGSELEWIAEEWSDCPAILNHQKPIQWGDKESVTFNKEWSKKIYQGLATY